jgi:hypothetical protein
LFAIREAGAARSGRIAQRFVAVRSFALYRHNFVCDCFRPDRARFDIDAAFGSEGRASFSYYRACG